MKLFIISLILSLNLINADKVPTFKDEDQELIECEKFDVCNIVTFPYFGKYNVEKLCICPEGTFCPATFSKDDDHSISINVRTQMKFCNKVEDLFVELPECEVDKVALVVDTLFYVNKIANISAKLTCQCNKNHIYWKHIMRSGVPIETDEKLFQAIDHFECSELTKCETNDFCGLARTDYGFIFQRCTCPSSDQCRYYVEESEIELDIEELFYNYSFYKSYCMRNENSEIW